MTRALVSSLVAAVLFTAVFGFAYPALMTGFAQVAFPEKADGSLVERDGQVVGSRLAAQAFTQPEYFHPRPSAVDYNAAGTSFANLGPTNPDLATPSTSRRRRSSSSKARTTRASRSATSLSTRSPPPAPASTRTSRPPTRELQAARIAEVRGLPPERVQELIDDATDGRFLGFFGEPGVNVLDLNLSLDDWRPRDDDTLREPLHARDRRRRDRRFLQEARPAHARSATR